MVKGLSLNIGLNSVDPKHYGGWDGQLGGCEYDAHDMADIAKANGFEVTKLITKDATVENLKKNLTSAAQNLKSGDYLLLTYSGHGGTLPDENNDEDDFQDETWCLYDRQFVDDELNVCLREFKEGVRIFTLSDSCHSGTVVKAAKLQRTLDIDTFNSNIDIRGKQYRFAPDAVLGRTYNQNRDMYDKILRDINKKEKEVSASVILISGCEDDELSQDGAYNGFFTNNLKRVYNNGLFKGSYIKLHKLILNRMMATDQHPKYFKDGKSNPVFEKSKPFALK
jgi:metacaspase-1